MRRRCVVLVALLCMLLSGCGQDRATTMDGDKRQVLFVSQSFSALTLTVMADADTYTNPSDIRLTASVKNTTSRDMALFRPVTGEHSHTEIAVRLENDQGLCLIDKDTYKQGYDDAISSLVLAPDERYRQEMTFRSQVVDADGEVVPAASGVYNGTATVKVLADPADETSATTEYTVEFKITLN